jgi:formylglycine-generating enzyme required for sulfatase activity
MKDTYSQPFANYFRRYIMGNSMKRTRSAVFAAAVCVALGGMSAYAKTTPEMVKQEPGYYYGYAKGDTPEAAELEAKRELISSALTTTLRAVNPRAGAVKVSDDSVNARLGDLKPYVQTKPKEAPAVTYRMKISDWDKKEKAYSDKLRTELTARAASISTKKSITDKIAEATAVLARLADEGETDLLTSQPQGGELLSRSLEGTCADLSKAVTIAVSAKDGFIDASSQITANVTDVAGAGVAGFPLTVSWDVSMYPTDASVASPDEIRTVVNTDSLGSAVITYPAAPEYHNRPVTLTVSTAFTSYFQSAALRKIDAASSVDACLVQYDDISVSFATVAVPAGKFNAGPVPQDTRAAKKEVAREAETGAYAVGTGLVTNAQYAAYLHATRASVTPEYFDNSDYNQGTQPVVGVSVKDAEAYAEWLSEQTGRTYRLPTEEEWEKAARAGKDCVYPWGDDSPAEGKKADYKGNGRFKGPSPVGSFESGKNAWGLADMAGNVWEWTSSAHNKDAESALRIVKGGSWMDGPTELRISNFRELDGEQGYADVGFRLVMEVSE